MSISYSAITNFGKATLPSVETWGTNMNILKDPPKSIMTRRIDKVGQTSFITETIDQSENRVAESILQFARGVNPSVSVSYSNNSNNGGQLSGGISAISNNSGRSASLPYKVNENFRPPVLTQFDLQPLSRLPRVWTTALTKPGFADFSKKMRDVGTAEDTKEVKNKLLNISARPTAVYKIETPISEPFEVKYVIQPFLKKEYNTALKSNSGSVQYYSDPTKGATNQLLHTSAVANKGDVRYNNNINNDIYKENYIQDINNTQAYTNLGNSYMNNGNINDIDFSQIRVNDLQNIDYVTQLKGDKYVLDYIHDDLELSRNLPEYEAATNFRGDKTQIDYIHDDIELQKVLPNHNANTNFRGDKMQTDYIHDDLDLQRNLPEYQANTNYKGDSNKVTYLHDDLELSRNLPEYEANTNYKGDKSENKYIHDDMELQRVLPEYSVITNLKENKQKILEHDYIKELERNTPLTNFTVNPGMRNEFNHNNSRDYNLGYSIKRGEFNIPAQIPTLDRMQQIGNIDSEKSRRGKMMMQQFEGRYMN